MFRFYQNIEFDKDIIYEDKNRKDSLYWNEGKFNTFVKPIIPLDINKSHFLEIGCNTGLFVKMARELGFKDSIGIDSGRRYISEGNKYRDYIKGDYRLYKKVVDDNFNLDNIPLLDLVLISNAHYYISVSSFIRLVDMLRVKSMYCIVVSARIRQRGGCAKYSKADVRGYFKDWREAGLIDQIIDTNDPAYREGMYGMCFKSSLTYMNVENKYSGYFYGASIAGNKDRRELPEVLDDFFKKALSGEDFDYSQTEYFKYWKKREPNFPDNDLLDRMERKHMMAIDIKENGMKMPIYFDSKGTLLDGLHRLIVARLLGHKTIISRIL